MHLFLQYFYEIESNYSQHSFWHFKIRLIHLQPFIRELRYSKRNQFVWVLILSGLSSSSNSFCTRWWEEIYFLEIELLEMRELIFFLKEFKQSFKMLALLFVDLWRVCFSIKQNNYAFFASALIPDNICFSYKNKGLYYIFRCKSGRSDSPYLQNSNYWLHLRI